MILRISLIYYYRMLEINDIISARQSIAGRVYETPLLKSESFGTLADAEVWLKCENLQKTGSFKVRGAFNRMLGLESGAAVIAASRGNHAQAVACAASELGLQARIVMPEGSPLAKQLAVKAYGGELVLHGSSLSEALDMAVADSERVFVHPYDDPLVMAGQGTLGLELAALPEAPDYVLVPVGGGGLISGVSVAVKTRWPEAKVLGVQAEAAVSATLSFHGQRAVDRPSGETIADGIAVGRVGRKCLEVMRRHVDDILTVGEDSIAHAVLMLLERKRLLVEGAGAVPLACLMDNIEVFRGKRVVLVISGGNMDITLIERILHMGLARSGRVTIMDLVVRDEPGSLCSASGVIAAQKGNILSVNHDRFTPDLPFQKLRVRFMVETLGADHSKQIIAALREAGFEVCSA